MSTDRNLQQEYKKARASFMRRQKEWLVKYHWYVEAPKIPKVITEKSIQRIKDIRLSNITEKQAKKYARQYDIEYEKGNINVVNAPTNTFNRPNNQTEYEQSAQTNGDTKYNFETEPEESESAIWADLRYLLDGLIEHGRSSSTQSLELQNEVEYKLRGIYESVLIQLENPKAYLSYLEDSNVHTKLTAVCDQAFDDSKEKRREAAIAEFATILNLGRPLDMEQNYQITAENSLTVDFEDTEY